MIRAVMFDFYGVWLPDLFKKYIAEAEQLQPHLAWELEATVNQYFHGTASLEDVAGAFRFKLNRIDIDIKQFVLTDNSLSPASVNYLRELHGHFLKVGILANLGKQELEILNNFNQANQVLETIASPLSLNSELPLLSQDVFAQALHAIGEPPANCIAISSDPEYQHFASSLGMSVLPFQGFPHLREALDQRLAQDLA
jgi:FMN phosphatase YigB (HAD superfamily)